MRRRNHDPAHGANKNHASAAKKRGENKGILAERRTRKREEAEARNAQTPLERTRAYRATIHADNLPKEETP